jgi:hypothetical protein
MSLTYEQLVAAWSAGRLMREEVIAWFQDHRWLQRLVRHRPGCTSPERPRLAARAASAALFHVRFA